MLQDFGRDHLAVAVDNRGFGESDKPLEVNAYSMEQIVADIRAIAAHYRAESFTLVGHDWGGIAAWHFAARYPYLLDRLIVLNAPHPVLFQRKLLSDAAQRSASQYFHRLRDPGAEERLNAAGLSQFWMSLFGDHLKRGLMSEEDRDSYLSTWSQPGALTAMLNWYRASPIIVADETAPIKSIPLSINGSDDGSNDATIVRVQTLVIWGMQDRLLLPCLLDDLAYFAPMHTIKRIENAGHGLAHEVPATIIASIREWICVR